MYWETHSLFRQIGDSCVRLWCFITPLGMFVYRETPDYQFVPDKTEFISSIPVDPAHIIPRRAVPNVIPAGIMFQLPRISSRTIVFKSVKEKLVRAIFHWKKISTIEPIMTAVFKESGSFAATSFYVFFLLLL